MKGNQPLYRFLYDSLVSQIEKGVLRQGDSLPSQQALCGQYNVGITTVRYTLRLLEQNGYIVVSPRRRPVVLAGRQGQAGLPRLLAEKEMVLDVYQSLYFLMPALETSAAQNFNDVSALKDAARAVAWHKSTPPARGRAILFFYKLIDVYQNQLLIDFLSDSEHFTHIPYESFHRLNPSVVYTPQMLGEYLLSIADMIEIKNFSVVHHKFQKLYDITFAWMKTYLHELEAQYPDVKDAPSPPFTPKKRLCLYTSVACDLYRRLKKGEFSETRYLPSLAGLQKEYHISAFSARQALGLLNDVGVVYTHDKKGTAPAVPGAGPSPLRIDTKTVFENLILFLDTLQILALTAGFFVKEAVQALSDEEAGQLALRWQALEDRACADSLFTALWDFLKEHLSGVYLKASFRQLEECLLWGGYLSRLSQDGRRVSPAVSKRYLHTLCGALRQKDAPAFARAASSFFCLVYNAARDRVLSCGAKAGRLPLPLKEEYLCF